MVKNYLLIAWRNLLKNKAFSLINILGLSIGIAVCFIIMLFVQDELSYDTFNANAKEIVRVVFKASINGGKINESVTMAPVAAAMKQDYPEVADAVRLKTAGIPSVRYGDKTFKDGQMVMADPSLFRIFSFRFLKGDPATALVQPGSMVLTDEMAKKYFGNDEPIGKTLSLYNGDALYKITGIVDKLPANAHFHYDLFATLIGTREAGDPSWLASNLYTYLLLKKGADYKKLEAKLPGMVEKYMGPQLVQAMGMNLSQFRTKGNELGFALQPLTSIHLHSATSNELEPGGDVQYVYIFGAVAFFMLLIAVINFINLSTAGASKRAKEVGLRKVMGSRKPELIRQFLLESVLITAIALVFAGILVQVSLPAFNTISGKHLLAGFSMGSLFAFLGLGLLVGIVSGIYPAFVLSSFTPITTLKGKYNAGPRSFGLRSSLVVFQFFISVTLIISTQIVYQQMSYIRNAKLGYDKEQLLVIPNSWALGKNERVLRDELLKDPRVQNVTISPYKPAGPTDYNNALAYPEGKDNQVLNAVEYKIDERYIPTLGMQMAQGRNFSPQYGTDSTAMIINEQAVRTLGLGFNPLGKRIVRQNSDRGKNVPYTVIGVVKDFHFKSLHEAITPLLMVLQPEWGLIIKVKPRDVAGLLASMQAQWKSYKTEEPFTYNFMDELYSKTYAAEQKTGLVLNIFAVLTILVACLGLFGLATYSAGQRSKEIGIRKVLGASVAQVTQMLSKDFLKLVLLGCLAAFPVSWFVMHKWLQDFAYRISINWWIFLLAGASALLIALFTISFKAIRAALANPVKSLRTE